MNVTGLWVFGKYLKVPLNLAMNLKLLLCLNMPKKIASDIDLWMTIWLSLSKFYGPAR